jgi:hypothetical protein
MKPDIDGTPGNPRKRRLSVLAAFGAASLVALASSRLALSRPDGPPDGPPPGTTGDEARPRRPRPPLELALDANGDGVIDADEIAKAPAALKKLDKNGDGKLTPDEYRPPRPTEGAGPQQDKGGQDGPR